MNVETINVWAQLIASIGVIVSLFYVAAQVRQNTRSSRAIVVDSLARSMHVSNSPCSCAHSTMTRRFQITTKLRGESLRVALCT